MKAAESKYVRNKEGFTSFARVTLAVHAESTEPGIEFACSGRGFYSQGYVEEVPALGYEDWKAGARAGVTFGLSIVGNPGIRVVVTKIEGLETTTNPTIVGAAAALAVWRALGFEPPGEAVEKLEAAVVESWRRPYGEVPNFA
jgi:hypothetical protein